jgi:hypothetical protein
MEVWYLGILIITMQVTVYKEETEARDIDMSR